MHVVDRRDQAGRGVGERRRLRPLTIRSVVDRPRFGGRVDGVTGAEPVGLLGEEPRVAHAERFEQPLAHELVEGLTGSAGDEHTEHHRAHVVEPPLAGLILQRQRRQTPDPFVGFGRALRLGRTGAQAQVGHRVHEGPRPRRSEVHPDAEPEREDVAHRDGARRGHGLAVEWSATVDEDVAARELGQQIVDGLVESEPAILDEDQRSNRAHRLRHRREAEDRVARDRPPLAPRQGAGDADFDVTVARGEPGETSGVSQIDMVGHGVVKATQPCLLESAHTPTYPKTDVIRRDRGRGGGLGALPAPQAARARPDGARVRGWR